MYEQHHLPRMGALACNETRHLTHHVLLLLPADLALPCSGAAQAAAELTAMLAAAVFYEEVLLRRQTPAAVAAAA
jgi:hypothetical protein